MADTRPVLVVGCGNPDCGDDAVGIVVLRALHGSLPRGVFTFEAAHDVTAILQRWTAYRHIVFIDAVVTGAQPGTVHRWTAATLPGFQPKDRASTHGISLRDVLLLAETLCGDTTHVSVIGIELNSTEFGSGVTPAVHDAIGAAVFAVLEEVEACMNRI